MIWEIEEAGLKMINSKNHCLCLKASWIKCMYSTDFKSSYYYILTFYLRITQYFKYELPQNNILLQKYPLSINRLIIQGYFQCNASCKSQDIYIALNVMQMFTWGNKYINNKMGDMYYFSNCIKSGILHLNVIKC